MSEAVKSPVSVQPGFHLCAVCQVKAVSDKYDLCYPCSAKRRFVYRKALEGGLSKQDAMVRAERAYPRKD